MRKLLIIMLGFLSVPFVSCSQKADTTAMNRDTKADGTANAYTVRRSEAEWKEALSKEEYYVLRQQGTERPFTGKFWDHKEKGIYTCAGCGNELFSSDTKFKSGTGWPSYWEPLREEAVVSETDRSHGMQRTEVHCASCEGHLGHVFNDGPPPTGLRYCINSVSLGFKKKDEVTSAEKANN